MKSQSGFLIYLATMVGIFILVHTFTKWMPLLVGVFGFEGSSQRFFKEFVKGTIVFFVILFLFTPVNLLFGGNKARMRFFHPKIAYEQFEKSMDKQSNININITAAPSEKPTTTTSVKEPGPEGTLAQIAT